MNGFYGTLRWRVTRSRALARDGHLCTVSRLLGGECSGALHVHHIVPVEEGGEPFALDNLGTACASHHPAWEALRRKLVSARTEPVAPAVPRCPHAHRTPEARVLCERRMARARTAA